MTHCTVTGETNCKCKYRMKAIYTPEPRDTLRKLFSDHANYTHLYIKSEIYQLPDLSVTTNRLLKNQEDIGDYFSKYVGYEAGNKLTKLLKQHILAASQVVKSSIDQKNTLNDDVNKLFENSENVSRFLGGINPDILDYDVIKEHFDEHNHYVIDLTETYLDEKYNDSIETYDCYYTHMLLFSDMLSLLIV